MGSTLEDLAAAIDRAAIAAAPTVGQLKASISARLSQLTKLAVIDIADLPGMDVLCASLQQALFNQFRAKFLQKLTGTIARAQSISVKAGPISKQAPHSK